MNYFYDYICVYSLIKELIVKTEQPEGLLLDSNSLPRGESTFVLECFVGSAVDQQVADGRHVILQGIVKWGITKTVLSVDIGTFLYQQVADIVTSELSRDRE